MRRGGTREPFGEDVEATEAIGEVDEERRGRHRVAVAVGAACAVVVTVAAGTVAVTLTDRADSPAVARAATAEILTTLGHPVTGSEAAVRRALPTATAALDGGLAAPSGLPVGGRDVVPPRVLEAYRSAEARLATESPRCALPWWLLAGIGKVQSDHAAGGQVDAAGTATVRIVGPRLDGTGVGSRTVRDTDRGTLDGDLTFDRGVGPMLLLPQTWSAIGRDGDGDGRTDVADVDDAALSVGTLLCSAGADLTTAEGLARGLVRLDDTANFPLDVLPWAAHYRAQGGIDAPGGAASGVPGTSAPGAQPTPGVPGGGTPATPLIPARGPGYTTQPTTAPPSSSPPPAVPRPVDSRPVATGSGAPRPVVPARPTNTPAAPRPTSQAPSAPRPTRVPVAPPPPARPTPAPVTPRPSAPSAPAPDVPADPAPPSPVDPPSQPADPPSEEQPDPPGDGDSVGAGRTPADDPSDPGRGRGDRGGRGGGPGRPPGAGGDAVAPGPA